MTIANVQVERSGAVPTQSLIEFKELLDMPALGIVLGQSGDLGELCRAQKALLLVIFWTYAAALNVLVVKGLGLGLETVRLPGRRVAGPVLGKIRGGHLAPALERIGVSWLSAEQIKDLLGAHGGEDFLAIVFLVGEDQGLVGRRRSRPQNFGGHVQELGAGLDNGLGRGTEAKADGLAGVTIEQEEGLGHFGGFLFGAETVSAHLALAVAGHAVGVQRQERAGKMSSRAAQFTQRDLHLLGLLDGVTSQEVVDGQVGGNEGQAVGQLKTFLGKRAPLAVGAQTHGGFIDQMQSQTRLDSLGGQGRPGAPEVPSAQTQVFGQQEPDADLIARNLIRQ